MPPATVTVTVIMTVMVTMAAAAEVTSHALHAGPGGRLLP